MEMSGEISWCKIQSSAYSIVIRVGGLLFVPLSLEFAPRLSQLERGLNHVLRYHCLL